VTFTEDWFSGNIPIWSRLLAEHLGKPSLRYLEIGVFEGRSTCWLLENVLTGKDSHIVCVDTFEGGMESAPADADMPSVRQRFESNILPWKDMVSLHVGASSDVLPLLTTDFDFVYIDGSHQAKDVLTDAVLCWRILRPNGIIIFDDYEWN
jgi:predicted O-methyltransferase YrrM